MAFGARDAGLGFAKSGFLAVVSGKCLTAYRRLVRASQSIGGGKMWETYVAAVQPDGDTGAFFRHGGWVVVDIFAVVRMVDKVRVRGASSVLLCKRDGEG